jgi:hypothetical protein
MMDNETRSYLEIVAALRRHGLTKRAAKCPSD